MRTEIDRDAAFLAAIGDPTRLRIVRLLVDRPHCVNEMQKVTGKRQQAISHHLTILKLRRIVEAIRTGKTNTYRLTRAGQVAARVAKRLGRISIGG